METLPPFRCLLGLGPGFLEGALVREGSREKAKQACGPSWGLASA